MTPSEVAAEHDRNWIATFEAISAGMPHGCHLRTRTVTVAASGTTTMNKVIVTDASPDPDDLARALALVRSRGLAFDVFIRSTDEAALRIAGEVGLVSRGSMPCMVRPQSLTLPQPIDGDLEVRRVDAPTISDFQRVAGEGFGMPARMAATVFRASLLELPAMRAFIGLVDGRPVACSANFVTGTTVGVYTVATVEAMRGRGYGTRMTAAAMTDTPSPATLAILQASDMGRPVYERMGFRTSHEMAILGDPRPH